MSEKAEITNSEKHENVTVLDDTITATVKDDSSGERTKGKNDLSYDNEQDEEWRCLLRKIDWHIIPQLFMISLFTSILRTNIGYAEVAGLTDDIAITDDQYNWAVSALYLGDIFFEVPCVLILKKVGAGAYLGAVLLVEGVLMCAIAEVKTGSQLIVARLFLGLIQSGIIAGFAFYTSLWYPNREQSLRIAIYFGVGSGYVAGAVAGLLAFGIVHMEGIQDLRGWQWLFIIEGIPSLVLAFIIFFFLPATPEKAKFLNQKERMLLLGRLRIDAGPALEENFSWNQFYAVFRDWKTYAFSAISFCTMMASRSLVVFLPTIIRGFGFDPIKTHAMTIPPYVAAGIFGVTLSATSDKYLERAFHISFSAIISVIGLALLIGLRDSVLAGLYVAICIVASGVLSTSPIRLSWMANCFGGHTKRVVALAVANSVGTAGSVVGGQVYRAKDAPHYVMGNSVMLGLLTFASLACVVTKFFLWRTNVNRDNMSIEERAALSAKEELCDKHPDFRYVL